MSHDYHEGAPNYNQHQLYYDGCLECAERATSLYPFEKIDLRAAWDRTVQFEKGLLGPEELPLSETEIPVLRLLWGLVVQLERYGFPIGLFPGDVTQVVYTIDDNLRRYQH